MALTLGFFDLDERYAALTINLECARTIREYLDAAPHSLDGEAWLFQPVRNGKPGSPLSRIQFYRLFERYARQAGVAAAAFPHMARATMITAAFEAGCAGEDILRTVGHASITMTEGYNHTAQKHRQSASLKIGY